MASLVQGQIGAQAERDAHLEAGEQVSGCGLSKTTPSPSGFSGHHSDCHLPFTELSAVLLQCVARRSFLLFPISTPAPVCHAHCQPTPKPLVQPNRHHYARHNFNKEQWAGNLCAPPFWHIWTFLRSNIAFSPLNPSSNWGERPMVEAGLMDVQSQWL